MMDRSDVLNLDLSGVPVRLTGARDGTLDLFREEWAAWLGPPSKSPALHLEYRVSGEPARDQAVLRKVLEIESTSHRTRFTTGEGQVDLNPEGMASAVLRPGGDRFRFYGLQNLLLAALSRVLPDLGILVVHGAGILLDGIAVALIGPEGAGKSTWARIAAEAGVPVLSDDLLFLGTDGEKAIALGSPFRGAGHAPGRWDLGMLLSARHAPEPAVLPCSRLSFQALLSANLPYSGDRVGNDDRMDRLLDTVLDMVPFRTLAFDRSPSFVKVLGSALAGGSGG